MMRLFGTMIEDEAILAVTVYCGGAELPLAMSAADLGVLLRDFDLETDMKWRETSNGIVGVRPEGISAVIIQQED
jgi:hypothetical protein